MILPPISIAAFHDFTTDIYGAPSDVKEDDKVAVAIQLAIFVQNLSSLTATGTLEFQGDNPNALRIGKVAKAIACCPDANFNYDVWLCGNDGKAAEHTHESSSGADLPKPVNWLLLPGASTTLWVSAIFTGAFSNTRSPGRAPKIYTTFLPALRIRVNEDRGAVLASYSARLSQTTNILPCGADQPLTGTPPSVGGKYGRWLPTEFAGSLYFVNGGRPF